MSILRPYIFLWTFSSPSLRTPRYSDKAPGLLALKSVCLVGAFIDFFVQLFLESLSSWLCGKATLVCIVDNKILQLVDLPKAFGIFMLGLHATTSAFWRFLCQSLQRYLQALGIRVQGPTQRWLFWRF